jgi:hypothetical protein
MTGLMGNIFPKLLKLPPREETAEPHGTHHPSKQRQLPIMMRLNPRTGVIISWDPELLLSSDNTSLESLAETELR